MAVTKRIRYEVLRRDNYTCHYCHSADKELTIDHVIPVALGGSDNPDNLVACCRDCNIGKTSTSPDEPLVSDVNAHALAFREALKQASNLTLEDIQNEEDYTESVLRYWKDIASIDDSHCLPYPESWKGTARYWFKINVPFDLIGYAFRVSVEKFRAGRLKKADVFRYSTGVIGNKMEETMERAMTHMRDISSIKHCGHCPNCLRYEDDECEEPATPDRRDCELYYPIGERNYHCNTCNDPDCVYIIGLAAGIDCYRHIVAQVKDSNDHD